MAVFQLRGLLVFKADSHTDALKVTTDKIMSCKSHFSIIWLIGTYSSQMYIYKSNQNHLNPHNSLNAALKIR